jgi:nitrogen fixation protein FixH
MTIGRSWNIAADAFNRDVEEDGTIKPSNVSTYKYVTDGPAISWKINGTDATEINVSNPQVVEITVTATKDGITESKTFRRSVAPASIRALAASTAALNGLWLEDVNAETDKVVIAQYNGKKLVSTKIISLKDNENYIAETGILKLTGFIAPEKNADVDALKVFVIGDKGISPITFKNAELNG